MSDGHDLAASFGEFSGALVEWIGATELRLAADAADALDTKHGMADAIERVEKRLTRIERAQVRIEDNLNALYVRLMALPSF